MTGSALDEPLPERSEMPAVRGSIPVEAAVPVGASSGVFLQSLERAIARLEDRCRELEIAYQDLRLEIAEKTRV